MKQPVPRKLLTRRSFLKVGGSALAAAAGATLFPRALLQPEKVVKAEHALASGLAGPAARAAAPAAQTDLPPDMHLAATDGWININAPAIPPYFPDDFAPTGLNTYMFGFRDVTGFTDQEVQAQKMKAIHCAPLFWLDQEVDFRLQLTNLGLQMRPDLIDSHTLHFHGFRNAIPIFDGEPHSSVGTPIMRNLTYFYRPHYPGTYMYHCHFEETEHVHMGMVGPCFIRPLMNQQYPGRKFAYNDLSTEYDREYVVFLSDVWAEAHWCDSHIQLPDWTDFRPDLFLLNGRAYPDTLLPAGGEVDATTKDLLGPIDPATGLRRDDLRYQPMSALISANGGERILLRCINLGFAESSMRLQGLKVRVVGRDAAPLVGRDGTDLSFYTSTPPCGPGESSDSIFVAPAFDSTGPTFTDYRGRYNRYLLYNRSLTAVAGGSGSAYGGQMTEVRVYETALPPQTVPNA